MTMGKAMSLKTRNIFRDDRGQLLTLDILVSLIPLVMILGISANAMTGSVNQVQDYIFVYDMQRGVNSAIDIIVKSPGTPVNWNVSTSPVIAGLATYNLSTGLVVPNFLDGDKLGGMNISHLSILLGGENRGLSYWNLNITGVDNKSQGFFLNFTNGSRAAVKDLFVAERIALLKINNDMGSAMDIGHKLSNDTLDCNSGFPGNPIFTIDFYVGTGETSAFDFWIYGHTEDEAGSNTDFDVDTNSSLPSTLPNCNYYNPVSGTTLFPCDSPPDNPPGGGPPEVCDDPAPSGGEVKAKILLNSQLVEGQQNRVVIQAQGSPAVLTDYYILKVPSGMNDTSVRPELAETSVVKVRLEGGI